MLIGNGFDSRQAEKRDTGNEKGGPKPAWVIISTTRQWWPGCIGCPISPARADDLSNHGDSRSRFVVPMVSSTTILVGLSMPRTILRITI